MTDRPQLPTPQTLSLATQSQPEPVREYLAFLIDDEPYAAPLAVITEIVTARKLTPVPRAAADILGICGVRGELITVVDTRLRLRRGRSSTERGRILLTITSAGEKLGLWVDEVIGVRRIPPEQIEPTTGHLSADAGSHAEGIGRSGGLVIVILNLASITA